MTRRRARNLVVAEYVDEYRHLVQRYGETMFRDPQTCVLALDPTLQVYLRARGVSYATTPEFFDKDSHEELATLSIELLSIIRDGLEIRDEFGVSVGYERALVFYTRFFLHHLLFLASVIRAGCRTLSPERVMVAEPRGRDFRRGPDLVRKERYLGQVTLLVCEGQDIPCETTQFRVRRSVSGLAGHLGELIKATGARVVFGVADTLLRRRRRGRTLVMAPSKSYNLGRVLEELRPALGYRYLPVYLQTNRVGEVLGQFVWARRDWSYPGLRVRVPSAASEIFASHVDAELTRLSTRLDRSTRFRYCGVDLASMVNERVRTVLRPHLLELHAQTAKLDELLDEHRPDLILSQLSMGWTANLGALAARKTIPAMLVPHGSMVPSSDRHALAEWREHGLGMTHSDYRYLAVQTPWTEAYLRQTPAASVNVRTGPLLFARPRRHRPRQNPSRRLSTEKTLLHVGTPKSRGSMRFWTYETVDEYVRNINAVIQAIERVGGYRLLIKFRPEDGLKDDAFRALLVSSPCYEVCSTGSLSDYMEFADLLVSYSSTAIEEALQLKIPVLQFDPQGKYCHVKGCLLDPSVRPDVGSCYFVANEDHLIWALGWLRANHLSDPQPESLWAEHRFEDTSGLGPFLETIGLATAVTHSLPKDSEH